MVTTLHYLETCLVGSDFFRIAQGKEWFSRLPNSPKAMTLAQQQHPAQRDHNGCLPIRGKGTFWICLDSIPKARFHISMKAG